MKTDKAPAKDKARVANLFNAIAPSYDFLNRFLSVGIDQYWRKQMAKHLHQTSDSMTLLDLATGTGDQVISLCKRFSFIKSAIGVDLAQNMLLIGRKKVLKQGLSQRIKLQEGDATNLDFITNSFDITSCSFGIRNVEKLQAALSEILRVLKPDAQLLILEFSLPPNPILRRLYFFYFRHILPAIGRLFSKHPAAYAYLNESVEHFPYGSDFTDILKQVGFVNPNYYPLTFGIATLYVAKKPEK